MWSLVTCLMQVAPGHNHFTYICAWCTHRPLNTYTVTHCSTLSSCCVTATDDPNESLYGSALIDIMVLCVQQTCVQSPFNGGPCSWHLGTPRSLDIIRHAMADFERLTSFLLPSTVFHPLDPEEWTMFYPCEGFYKEPAASPSAPWVLLSHSHALPRLPTWKHP